MTVSIYCVPVAEMLLSRQPLLAEGLKQEFPLMSSSFDDNGSLHLVSDDQELISRDEDVFAVVP